MHFARLLLLTVLLPGAAAAQAPVLQRSAPRALKPGATSTLRLSGQHLAAVDAVAVDHATTTAARLGYTSKTDSATSCEGLAEDIGRVLADEMIKALEDGVTMCRISGGEPTVELAARSGMRAAS